MQNVQNLVQSAAFGAVSVAGPVLTGGQSNFRDTNAEQAVGQVEELPTGLFVVIILFVVTLFVGMLIATYNLVPSYKAIHTVLVFLTGIFWITVLWLWYGWVKGGRIQV